MLAEIGAGNFVVLAGLAGDHDDLHLLGLLQERQASAMARVAARLPSQHTMTRSSLRPAFWM